MPFVVALSLLAFSPALAGSSLAAPPASAEASMPVSQSDPEKVETWATQDPYGVSMSLLAMMVVFISLLVLYVLFRAIGKSMGRFQEGAAPQDVETAVVSVADPQGQGDEVAAAISLALQQAFYMHDEESGVITLKPHASAWNLKNYGLPMTPET